MSKELTFTISSDEVTTLNKWKDQIKSVHGKYGQFTYSFSTDGIGRIITVHSHLTAETLDLTDVSTW